MWIDIVDIQYMMLIYILWHNIYTHTSSLSCTHMYELQRAFSLRVRITCSLFCPLNLPVKIWLEKVWESRNPAVCFLCSRKCTGNQFMPGDIYKLVILICLERHNSFELFKAFWLTSLWYKTLKTKQLLCCDTFKTILLARDFTNLEMGEVDIILETQILSLPSLRHA